jgi:3-oxoadipate enol-lactonase
VALIEVDGVRLYVEDSGAPPGRPDAIPVLFGHGVLFSGRSFAGQVARLRDRHRCVTIDWRGQGRSPATASGYDMDTLTEDVVGVIEALELGLVHYVGLSMGGFVGIRLAARHPDLVHSLTLLDTSAGPEPPANIPRYKLLARVYGLLGIRPVRSRVETIMFGPTYLADRRSTAETDAWIAELSAAKRSGIKKAIYGVTDRQPVLDLLPRITAPTLVAVGADDVATPLSRSEALVAGIAGARLEVVPAAGHSSSIEQPEIVADLIEAFIEGRRSSA